MIRRRLTFVLVALGFFPIGCSTPGPECTTDPQCIGGWVCVASRCVDPLGLDADGVADVAPIADSESDSDGVSADLPSENDVTDEAEAQPKILVSPDAVVFDDTGLFVSTFADIRIDNHGTAPLSLTQVRLELVPSGAFQVLPPFPPPARVEPSKSTFYRVRFRPSFLAGQGTTSFENAVLVRSDDRDNPTVRVPITGLGFPSPARCLTFDENGVSMGFVPVGEVGDRIVVLRNCGQQELTISNLVATSGHDELSAMVFGGVPFDLDVADSREVKIQFRPDVPDLVYGTVLALSEQNDEAEVFIEAGVACPVAVVSASFRGNLRHDALGGYTNAAFLLSGAESTDPAAGELRFDWTITPPDDSIDIDAQPDLTSRDLSVVPDVPGVYEATLWVTSATSGLRSCTSASILLDVYPQNPAITVSVAWNNGADLDLHLLRSRRNGTFGAWAFGGATLNTDDVFYANPSPDFGVSGEFDDPRYLGDDDDGYGPEAIIIPGLEANRRYKIGVQLSRSDGAGPVAAEVTVTFEGGERLVFDRVLTEVGKFWVPAILESDGSVTAVDTLE